MEDERPAAKRTHQHFGMVVFPVNSLEYEDSGEGSTFVELWAMEKRRGSCGVGLGYGNISGFKVESLAGTDAEGNEDNIDEFFLMYRKGMDTNGYVRRFPLEERLFPDITRKGGGCLHCKQASVPLLACITMGSSSWRGVHRETQEQWRCGYNDLNVVGRAFYDGLRWAYPGAELMLVTWVER